MYSCRFMGLRFLHPVLCIDDVELTKHSRNTIDTIHSTALMLKSMKLKPALRDRLCGRRLTSTEIWRFCRRLKPAQLTHLPEEINASSRLETKSQCIICLDKDASTIVVPCGHQVMCRKCALQIPWAQDSVLGCMVLCPLCRQDGHVLPVPA